MIRATSWIPKRILSKHTSAICSKTFATKLVEVGRLNAPNTTDRYITGQLFVHRLFGYRGLVLFPWSTRVFDRDQSKSAEAETVIKNTDTDIAMKGDKISTDNLFYNVLIDKRDQPFVRAHTSSITLLQYNQEHSEGDINTIPGLDYVSHQDVLPYTPSTEEKWPFQHHLADQFYNFLPNVDPPFRPNDNLLCWYQQNRQRLAVREVHRQTTEKIRVTVIPFFLCEQESLTDVEFWWQYWICLENTGRQAVRLRKRYWRIFSENGLLETVRGRGVLGQEPVLSPQLPAFQYTSHARLHTPNGHMWGKLSMEREDGTLFDCKIPRFCLKRRQKLDDFE